MDSDNRKVYGDTSITALMVLLTGGSNRPFRCLDYLRNILFCQVCQWGQGEEQGLKRITKFSQVYLTGPFSLEKNIFCTFIEWDFHGSLKGLPE